MNPRVVLDTNILLDLLYFKDQRVTDLQYALQNKTLDFWVSPPILAEYHAVLLRPQFQLSPEYVHEIMHQIHIYFKNNLYDYNILITKELLEENTFIKSIIYYFFTSICRYI